MSKIYIQESLHGTEGQVIGFNQNGQAIVQDKPLGGFSPKIVYTAASGMIVTATKGSKTVNAKYESGSYVMNVDEFGTWTVSNGSGTTTVEVSEVKDYTVAIVSSVLNDNDWAIISTVSSAGTAASYWNVGDCKEITINGTLSDGLTLDNAKLWVFIIGFDHDIDTELNGGHTITFNGFKTYVNDSDTYALVDSGYGSEKTSGTWFNMNNSDTNIGSWNSSRMRSTVIPQIISSLPLDLQSVLKTVKKKSIKAYNQSTLEEISDKLFLLAESEIFGGTNYASISEGTQYPWFSSKGITISSYANNIRYRYGSSGATTNTCFWWERSPVSGATNGFCCVITDGSPVATDVVYPIGVSPAFCV